MGKKVLVTGCDGFIGSNLCPKLLELGYNVVGIDDHSSGQTNKTLGLFVYGFNIVSELQLKQFFIEEMPDYVIHLAARARIQPSIEDPTTYFENNVAGTANLLEISRKFKVSKFLQASSSSVYGDQKVPYRENQVCKPKNPYAMSKLLAEQWAKLYADLYGLETISFRFFNVYGKNMAHGQYATVMTIFKDQLKNNQPLTIVGDGTQKRDFTHVDDICSGIIAALESKRSLKGTVFNLGAGNARSVNEVADLMKKKTGKKSYYPHKNIHREAEVQMTLASIKKAKKYLNWEPRVVLEKGINDV